jgi:5'-nucleotidase/UDP-sugar diphosphatase
MQDYCMFLRKFLAFGLVVGLAAWLLNTTTTPSGPFTLTIIHTNDIHAWHEPQPVNEKSSIGGQARLATAIRRIRDQAGPSILVDAGDRFAGTLFFNEYKGLENVKLMNWMGYHAMALGNHEFDEGDQGLANFIDQLNFPVLACNVDVSRSPVLRGKIQPATIVPVADRLIGIVGLVTADTKTISNPSADVTFSADYLGKVQATATALRLKGAHAVILVSHLGLAEDKKLAEKLSGINVIIGGHSHTLLSNRHRAKAEAEYPLRVVNREGLPVFIAQAYWKNQYVGRLDVTFDSNGRAIHAEGDTILLDESYPLDPTIEAEVKRLAGPIDSFRRKIIPARANGPPPTITLTLPNDRVRQEETLLGNLVADAYRSAAKAQIGLIGGGGLRAPLPGNQPLTYGDIYTTLPFGNILCRISLSGADLVAALEHGVAGIEANRGQFLQVSGLRYRFERKAPVGQRIRSVEVQRGDSFVPIDRQANYTIALDSFLRNGGDGFTMFRDKASDVLDDLGPVTTALMTYIAQHAPVTPRLEGRIQAIP